MKSFFDSWVEAHKEELLRDVGRLISIRSVKGEAQDGMPFGEGPAKALAVAQQICEELGFDTTNYDNYVLSADAVDAPRGLDILCHLDVVGEGVGWDSDPYEAVIRNGCIWGRGSDDDKGPAVASMYAMRAVMECGIPMKRNVRLILGTDEESGSADIDYYYKTKNEKPAPSTFSPDNAFPVYNVEKGLYRQSFRKNFLQTEKTPRITKLEGGYRFNVVPPEASALVEGLTDDYIVSRICSCASTMGVSFSVENGRISVHGISSHASLPQDGTNALTALLSLLVLLPLADTPSTRAIRELNELFPHGDHYGNAIGIAAADEISGTLTLAFSVLKMDESGLSGTFDSRTPLCVSSEDCLKTVHGKMIPLGYEMEGNFIPPHYTPADTVFVQTLLRAYEMYSGKKGECIASGGATYCHDVPGGVAFGAAMPGVITNLHSANEHVPIQDLLTATKIFAQVIFDLCC